MSTTRTDIGRADSIAVLVILIAGAGLGGFIAGRGLITGMFRLLDPSRYPIELLADIPVSAGSGILDAHGDSLIVTAAALPTSAVWLFALSDLIGAAAIGLVTAAFAYALARIVQRKPFHRSMRTAAVIAGLAITFGSLFSQALRGFGQMVAADDLNPSLGDVAQVGFLFEPLPILIGFAVLALTYVFQAGARMQKDTEGLV
ncbi:hypothetical protein FM104_15045 [Microbacterium esteraromaticum]|uniref:DUF2975 domain-containing protein n=1 Tax=Microbacterium esteraromaticum TaxID=57043 RepID=A0A1R4KQ94_9MICO|nr:hypothetical protein [Microbacterium esteraromaticum]SJN46566.1 hypothetical protein FM104_15045 [Microbacterium esteraromaticum]